MLNNDMNKEKKGNCGGNCHCDGKKKSAPEFDHISKVETTGHEWDGLKELNNPLPRWWVWVFLITIIWSIGYWIVYPAWPTISGSTKGSIGWTQYSKLANEQQEITDRKKDNLELLSKTEIGDIKNNESLYRFTIKGGEAAFKDNCATCHGTGAQGALIYPNLNDDDWLWGGTLEDIQTTITHGIRSYGDDNTRDSQMPAFGRDKILEPEQISSVADFVLTLSKNENEAEMTESVLAGQAIFAENCASCHGEKGQGGREFGAPALNDAIWLRGSEKANIVNMIVNANMGMMPHWQGRLDTNTIKMLASYIHSLGGGE